MIAVDTNILVYARRTEAPYHERSKRIIEGLALGDRTWALAWPCIYEFVRVVTHPRVFNPPSDLNAVLRDLDSLLHAPSLVLLGEGPSHFSMMRRILTQSRATGNLVHDAHIAALVLEHGVEELITADRDFTRFPGLRVTFPF